MSPAARRGGRWRSTSASTHCHLVPVPSCSAKPATEPAYSAPHQDRKSTRLNSSHLGISYAVFCLKKKKTEYWIATLPEHGGLHITIPKNNAWTGTVGLVAILQAVRAGKIATDEHSTAD